MNATQAHAFAYHEISGKYIKRITTDPDPMREGYFLYPAHTTLIQPPAVNEPHEAARFDRQAVKWQVVPAWIDKALYVKQTRAAYEIGTTISLGLFNGLGDLPDWLTDKQPPSEFHIWQQKEKGQGDWVLDQKRFDYDIVLKRQVERKEKMDKADLICMGLRDMVIADLLYDDQKKYYEALATYKYQLIDLDLTQNLDQAVDWPEMPVDPREKLKD